MRIWNMYIRAAYDIGVTDITIWKFAPCLGTRIVHLESHKCETQTAKTQNQKLPRIWYHYLKELTKGLDEHLRAPPASAGERGSQSRPAPIPPSLLPFPFSPYATLELLSRLHVIYFNEIRFTQSLRRERRRTSQRHRRAGISAGRAIRPAQRRFSVFIPIPALGAVPALGADAFSPAQSLISYSRVAADILIARQQRLLLPVDRDDSDDGRDADADAGARLSGL